MLTLSLLRHAKSSWADPRLKDFERPLNERGEEVAPRMGAFMARRGIAPDLILCSTAVRARQTLDLVRPHLSGNAKVLYEDALYLASPSAMLKHVGKVPANVRHVMVVGHDPGLHTLAQQLATSGRREDLEALAEKFPTAALAVIAFQVPAWDEVKRVGGRLELFMVPKRLSLCAAAP
jgi:phosphohistidine phosphatase